MSKIYYDLEHDDPAPTPGRYLVSIGKKGIGSIWIVRAVHKVRHKCATRYQRYILETIKTTGLKPVTVIDGDLKNGCDIWVRGEEALGIVWNPRKKKAQ